MNKPISDNTAFPFETNVRAIAGIAGFKTGTPNTNTKIGGTQLVQSVINAGSTNAGGLAVYATSGAGKELATYISLNYSSGTTSTPAVLELGTPSHPSTVQISGNFNGPDPFVSPKVSFLTKNATSGSNTVSISPAIAATANQNIILPEAQPSATGEIIQVQGISGDDVTLEWATPSGGIDFSSLDINGIKADLTQSSQPQYGSAITIKANGAISNGDVVVSDYSTGEVRGLKPTTLPTQNTITGVAIEDIADGDTGKVLIYGYATVNYNSVAPTSTATNLELDSVSNGNTLVLTPGVIQPFSDSGGTGSNYSSSQTYTHIFDAGAGERVQLTINSFEFEGTADSAFDRLGFQESADDVTYTNVAFTPGLTSSTDYSSGWRRMDTNPGWQSGSGVNNDVTQGPYADGYVLPGDNSTGAFTLPLTVTTTQRYLKVFFYSDSGVTRAGWDIDIETTGTVPNTNTGLGAFVYLDAADVARGTNQIGTGRLLGIATGGTTANNSTVIFVEPPRVT